MAPARSATGGSDGNAAAARGGGGRRPRRSGRGGGRRRPRFGRRLPRRRPRFGRGHWRHPWANVGRSNFGRARGAPLVVLLLQIRTYRLPCCRFRLLRLPRRCTRTVTRRVGGRLDALLSLVRARGSLRLPVHLAALRRLLKQALLPVAVTCAPASPRMSHRSSAPAAMSQACGFDELPAPWAPRTSTTLLSLRRPHRLAP